MNDPLYIEILETLRVMVCPQCGAIHAVMAALFESSRANQTPIYCPFGHATTPLPADAEVASNDERSLIEVRSRLAETRAKLEAAQRRIAELTPLADPDRKELRRRSNLLASRAEEKPFGRAVCALCGQQKSQGRLAEHIRRQHREALAAMPPTQFV